MVEKLPVVAVTLEKLGLVGSAAAVADMVVPLIVIPLPATRFLWKPGMLEAFTVLKFPVGILKENPGLENIFLQVKLF